MILCTLSVSGRTIKIVGKGSDYAKLILLFVMLAVEPLSCWSSVRFSHDEIERFRGSSEEANLSLCFSSQDNSNSNNNKVAATLASDQEREMQQTTTTMVSRTKETDLLRALVGNVPIMRPNLNPYPQAEILKALTREYKIGSFVWTNQADGDQLWIGDFPADLFAIAYIAEKLSGYKFFASKVRVKIVLQSTKFCYGSLFAAMQPNCTVQAMEDWYLNNYYAIMQNPGVVISAQQGRPVELLIDWIPTSQYLDISADQSGLGRCGVVSIHVMNALSAISIDGAAAVNGTVYASFVDPELCLFDSQAQIPAMAFKKKIRGQSGVLTKVMDLPDTVIEGTSKILDSVVSQGRQALHTVSAVIGPVSDIVDSFGVGLSKPPIPSAIQRVVVQPFAHSPHVDDVSECVRLSHNFGCEVSIDEPKMPSPSSVTLQDVIRRPGLVKVVSDTNAGSSPGAAVCIIPILPSYSPTVGTGYQMTNLASMSQLFAFWRGGIKYLIQFWSSSYQSARYAIVHTYEVPVDISNVLGNYAAQLVDVSGDVQVPVMVPYVASTYAMPVCAPGAETEVNVAGYLAIFRLTNIVSPDATADPGIFINIWQAAAEDFTFIKRIGLSNTQVDETSLLGTFESPKIQGQCNVFDVFQSQFDGLNSAKFMPERNFLSGDSFSSIREFCHRPSFCPYQATVTSSFVGPRSWPDDPSPTTSDSYGVNDYIANHFRFWRGSVRYHCVTNTASLAKGNMTSAAADTLAPGSVANPGWDFYQLGFTPWPSLLTNQHCNSVEIPWYHHGPIRPIQDSTEYWLDPSVEANMYATNVNYGATGLAAWSCGDDFSLYCWKPALVYYPTTPSAGVKLRKKSKKIKSSSPQMKGAVKDV